MVNMFPVVAGPILVMKASVLLLLLFIIDDPKYPVPAKYPATYALPILSVATQYAVSSPVPPHQRARRNVPVAEISVR